jgi:hypothetical protein
LCRSLMSARMFLSILGSRFSTSRPPYCNRQFVREDICGRSIPQRTSWIAA